MTTTWTHRTEHARTAGTGPTLEPGAGAWLQQLTDDNVPLLVTFAGQGADWLPGLRDALQVHPDLRRVVDRVSQRLTDIARDPEVAAMAVLPGTIDLLAAVDGDEQRLDPTTRAAAPVSQPGIALAQLVRWETLLREGLAHRVARGRVAFTGHSQGLVPALAAASSRSGHLTDDQVVDTVSWMAWQGITMQACWRRVCAERGTTTVGSMVSIAGVERARLIAELERFSSRHAGGPVSIALYNTPTRHVVAGVGIDVAAFVAHLERVSASEQKARDERRMGGAPLRPIVETLPTSVPFHASALEPARRQMAARAASLTRPWDDARALGRVILCDDARIVTADDDLLDRVLATQFDAPTRWSDTVTTALDATGARAVLDIGPTDGVCRLTRSVVRGAGVPVVALDTPAGRTELFTPGAAPATPVCWDDFAPRRLELPDGNDVVANRYTEFTGHAPVILAGMTPTTVEVPIVAAAANAGFTAELAGGGQVTEAILTQRFAELGRALDPGAGVVFNALYLDRYLWDLHFGNRGLVLEARRGGAPLCGVTVSAGIPPVDEAVPLLDRFVEAGLWLNAFKPGTVPQIRQVLAIADAAPHHTVVAHVEGGTAGGHHSWEGLEDLLLATYGEIRERANVILCVGGGVGTPERAAELLTGAWSRAHGRRAMPVDGVLIGTAAMACAEAATSASVKAALVAAAGTDGWVLPGQVGGDVTSGRSSLDADIHYLDNTASRAARLLDQVAGNDEAVAARHDEIVAALAGTCKPYLGDVARMTYPDLIARMVELMAIGRHGAWDDGAWVDVSWRQRVFDVVRRAEARMVDADHGGFEPVVRTLSDLDDPSHLVPRLRQAYPSADAVVVGPLDAAFFVEHVCRRPGKPVPFVPVIDADVRRWFASDSLWYAHDDRYDADAVLVIPGPVAVAGIRAVDEPVAELLQRIEADAASLAAPLAHVARDDRRLRIAAPRQGSTEAEHVVADASTTVAGFLARLAAGSGPVAAVLAARDIRIGDRTVANLLHALCTPLPGTRADISRDLEGRTTRIVVRAPDDGGSVTIDERAPDTVHIRVELDADGLRGTWQTTWRVAGARGATRVWCDADTDRDAVRDLYAGVLFGGELAPTPLFETAHAAFTVTAHADAAWQATTGAASLRPGPSRAFALAWPAIFRVLAADELAEGLLRLVHERNAVDTGAAWPPQAGDTVSVEARVVAVTDGPRGRRVVAVAALGCDRGRLATVRSSFVIRGDYATTVSAHRERDAVDVPLSLDEGAWRWLEAQPWCRPVTDARPQRVGLRAELGTHTDRGAVPRHTASGVLVDGDVIVAAIDLSETTAHQHPVRHLAERCGAAPDERPTPALTLATRDVRAPDTMAAFAHAGDDHNPIHRSPLAARLAGLDAPIVHGMWTAARLEALVVETVCDAVPSRLVQFDAAFLAPLALGARLSLQVVRRAVRAGRTVVEATATDVARGTVVVRATAEVTPRRTALVFPGQGIQRPGMGMEGYARSAAARAVWDRADRHARQRLGFSILRVVRDNPRRMAVGRDTVVHPDGVLYLTQFTQVAMAVLASAQVAELREQGVLIDDAVCCGHSVGEYNALAAVAGVLDIEAVVDLVYLRGLTMHALVPRDEHGRSGWRMGVVRPHDAGLDHAGAERLVAEVREATGEFVEIVNYNVRGRQYSVTGTVAGLAAFEKALDARRPEGGRSAWIEVPGVDVPFHSTRLRDGVPAFRATLDARLPARIPWQGLVGRYVPNLVPRPFTLHRSFAEEIVALTGSAPLSDALDAGWDALDAGARARLLLIELLAWQFASPVRWIETQDVLVAPAGPVAADAPAPAGLGVERVVEIGLGSQPTLANMMRYTLALSGRTDVAVLNVEADADLVFARDADPEPVVAEVAAPTPAAAEAVPLAVVASAPPAGPRPPALDDAPLAVAEAVRALLALQARMRPEQIAGSESMDAVFDGVSSRRNQALMDLGAEFGIGSIDGAHELAIDDLCAEVSRRAPRYAACGKVLGPAVDAALQGAFGGARMRRNDIVELVAAEWALPAGRAESFVLDLALASRDGDSVRGGALGASAGPVAQRAAALERIDGHVPVWAAARGLTVGRASAAAAGGGAVDASAVRAVRDELLGDGGALDRVARALEAALGRGPAGVDLPALDEAMARLSALDAEVGAELATWVAPLFDARRHVELSQPQFMARRDIARLFFDAARHGVSDAHRAEAMRLAAFADVPVVRDTVAWFASRATALERPALAALLGELPSLRPGPAPVVPRRPAITTIEGVPHADEVDDPQASDAATLAAALRADARLVLGADDATRDQLCDVLDAAGAAPLDLRGEVAVVTGASPGSIAFEVVRHLLRGGATVVVTTTTATRERIDAYRVLYRQAAGPGAALHVVPMNQGSMQDVDALVDWLFDETTEQAGAGVRVLKPATPPTLLLPFGAVRDGGTVPEMGPWSSFALRAMVTGVERMVGRIAERAAREGVGDRRCHVVLPLSPNHGVFGGDGAYGASKAALEVLMNRAVSEYDAWGHAVTMCGARIGWVRGTGLMAANDLVSAELEARLGLRTFGNDEMGWLLAAMCDVRVRDLAAAAPLTVDLTAGLGDAADLADVVRQARADLEAQARIARRIAELEPAAAPTAPALALPASPFAVAAPVTEPIGEPLALDLDRTVVIVGVGEVGPWGSARTRFVAEVSRELSAAAVLELAWMCGLIRFERGAWVDAETGEQVDEASIVEGYGDAVRNRSGLRFVDPDAAGYDADGVPLMQSVWLEEDMTFAVASEDDARAFVDAEPEHTVVERLDDGTFRVTRRAGTAVRVPRTLRLDRRVAGLLPTGLTPERYGVPAELVDGVDRVALFNVMATADAFLSAGMEPWELYAWMHPARVANTQGAGMGGMQSLRRLYLDPLLGTERQSDVLQESLMNVMAAWVVQACVGSYGSMVHPVAACATAAVSLEEACDKILADRADVVVAGGFDDICAEGVIGFADMNATADTDALEQMGLAPDEMSRANDLRRRGFVEAHGGGTFVVARASVAIEHGLPIEGVVAYAGSFGDGIHRSIPAPGLGAVSAAAGGARSPLGRALSRLGLSADDIGVVYKHDTSTAANDPNENRLHHTLQTALGRTPGNPLWVVSQKTLTGHPKGGAAAWQIAGALQSLQQGIVAGNRTLQTVDPAMQPFTHMAFTDETLDVSIDPPKAALVTSLGFGHVSVVVLLAHPGCLLAALDDDTRASWAARATARRARAAHDWQTAAGGMREVWLRRTDRGFAAPDGSEAQAAEEIAALLDPQLRWVDGGWTRARA